MKTNKTKPRFLKKNIVIVMSIFICIILLVLVWGSVVTMRNEDQIKDGVEGIVRIYGQDIDSKFYAISETSIDFLMNNQTVGDLSGDSKNSLSAAAKVKRVNDQKALLTQFQTLSRTFGQEYHFFFYNSNQGMFIQSGSGDVREKRCFQKLMEDDIEEGALNGSQTFHWEISSRDALDYVYTVCGKDGIFVGCWISLEKFMNGLSSMADVGGIFVLGNEDALLWKSMDESLSSKQSLQSQYSGRYDFHYGDFSMAFLVNEHIRGSLVILQLGIVLAVGISLGAVIFMVRYVQRSVLMPILYFSNCVENYKKQGTFESDCVYEEFGEAARLLKSLEREIKTLKIQIYERELDIKKAELDYLQIQIRPHFYINCLNSIHSMIEMDKGGEAQNLIIFVSGYLRSVFRHAMELVPLGEELKNIDCYLEIHRILYRQGFGYKLDMDPALGEIRVPPLLIHTFVENCIKHTLELEGSVDIEVAVRRRDMHSLHITIADNGGGFLDEFLADSGGAAGSQAEDSRFQVGLRNVRSRLELLYHGEARLLLENSGQGGARVTVDIPVMEDA